MVGDAEVAEYVGFVTDQLVPSPVILCLISIKVLCLIIVFR